MWEPAQRSGFRAWLKFSSKVALNLLKQEKQLQKLTQPNSAADFQAAFCLELSNTDSSYFVLKLFVMVMLPCIGFAGGIWQVPRRESLHARLFVRVSFTLHEI